MSKILLKAPIHHPVKSQIIEESNHINKELALQRFPQRNVQNRISTANEPHELSGEEYK